MSNATLSDVYQLKCAVQNYDWGKLGEESKVAQFAAKTPDGFKIDKSKAYAELWMGTHPNGPSLLVKDQTTSLKDVIAQNPYFYLSSKISQQYDNDLPFLFKVLSVSKALSIQAHPDKKLGRELFEKFPKIYKDPNHKPEMAVAITTFEALCGFRSLNEIANYLDVYPEFREIVSNEIANRYIETVSQLPEDIERNKAALKELFAFLMTQDANTIANQVKRLATRLTEENEPSKLESGSVSELVVRLNQQFPGDVGIFCVFLLNYVRLEPGQAIFLGANEPHAYLSGDCVECMAASDNVVRAGLTPKFKDVDVLVKMLTYRYGSAKSQILQPESYQPSISKHSLLYDPPIDEFSVILTQLPAGDNEERFAPINGPSIIIVTEGSGIMIVAKGPEKIIEMGNVYFIAAASKEVVLRSNEGLVCYRAFCS
ncbi:6871_t:CDS:2 [Ambispora gerdemannii]|uniref:Mannose-6-phosphate isomerase n=1 Tax=Ambispora gerdemannii TaxID=144530 RepID=A0A9N9F6V2_9GLOM|nr:6871_t:CDS:2 [Ambispora gerdemannii]